jgi:hypothetical protein
MIGMAGLLFPNDGTHEQQLVGYSGLDYLFIFLFFSLSCTSFSVLLFSPALRM